MNSSWYWILGIIAIVAAALASWSIKVFLRYNKVSAKNNSTASGRDIIVHSNKDTDTDRGN